MCLHVMLTNLFLLTRGDGGVVAVHILHMLVMEKFMSVKRFFLSWIYIKKKFACRIEVPEYRAPSVTAL